MNKNYRSPNIVGIHYKKEETGKNIEGLARLLTIESEDLDLRTVQFSNGEIKTISNKESGIEWYLNRKRKDLTDLRGIKELKEDYLRQKEDLTLLKEQYKKLFPYSNI
jgi:hypothetical protein